MDISPWLLEILAPGELPLLADGYLIPTMKTVEEIRHERLVWLRHRYRTVQEFADAIGKAQSQVSQLLSKAIHSSTGKERTMGKDLARQIEAKLNLAQGLMDTPMSQETPTPPAHPLSFPDVKLSSPFLEWGVIRMKTLPQAFKVAAQDDAMAPRLKTGQIAEFEVGLELRPGDGVLVRDEEGEPCIRCCRRAHGVWEAYAEDERKHLPFTIGPDQLLAVLVGVHARWG